MPENFAMGDIASLVLGPIGSSPATTAGMEAWKNLVEPQVKQQQALQGTAYGGAADEAIAQSASGAAVPLIQQEVQNRMGVLGPLLNLGQMQSQDVATALQSAGMSRDVQAQQDQAAFEDYLRRYQLAQQITLGPVMNLGPNFGGMTSTTRTSGGGGGILGTVVCTELHRQGKLTSAEYAIETFLNLELATYRPLALKGYHRFGAPIAKRMRSSKALSLVTKIVVKWWMRQNSYLLSPSITFCEWLGAH